MSDAAAPAARSPVLDDRSLLGHPKWLGLLFFTEMWERLFVPLLKRLARG